VATLASNPAAARAGDALPRARAAGHLAEASYALYQTERHPPAALDWQATLVAGHHAVRGAEALLRACPADELVPWVASLAAMADDVVGRFERVAQSLLRNDRTAVTAGLHQPPATEWPTDLGQALYSLADLRVWLDGLREDLDRIPASIRGADGQKRAELRSASA
jgi:hypothetical protein